MKLFDIRDGRESDWPFVFATWLRAYADSRAVHALTDDKREYFTAHHAIVEAILHRGKLVIATALGDENTILGYAVYEPGVLHFCYVKASFRKHGVGRALVQACGPIACYTHRTRLCDVLPLPDDWRYSHYRV